VSAPEQPQPVPPPLEGEVLRWRQTASFGDYWCAVEEKGNAFSYVPLKVLPIGGPGRWRPVEANKQTRHIADVARERLAARLVEVERELSTAKGLLQRAGGALRYFAEQPTAAETPGVHYDETAEENIHNARARQAEIDALLAGKPATATGHEHEAQGGTKGGG
jgi:hypothetical protein